MAASRGSSYDLSDSGSDGGVSSGSPGPESPRQQRTPAASPAVARRIGPGAGSGHAGDNSAAATASPPTRKRVPLNDEQRRERRRRANRESARRMRQKKSEMLSELQATLTNALSRAQALATDNARLRDLLRRNGINAPPPLTPAAAPAPRISGAVAPATLEAQHSAAADAVAAAVAAAATGGSDVLGGGAPAVASSEPLTKRPSFETPATTPAAVMVAAPTMPPSPSPVLQGPADQKPPTAAAVPSVSAPGSQAAGPTPNDGAAAAMSRLAQHGALAAAAFSLAPWPHNAPGGLPPPSFTPSAAPSVTAPLTVTGGRSPHRPCISTSSVHLSSSSWLGAGAGDGAPSVAAGAAGLAAPRPRRRCSAEPPSPGQGARPAKRARSPPSMSLSLSTHAGSSGPPPPPLPGAVAARAAALSLRPAAPAVAAAPTTTASAVASAACCPPSLALSCAAPAPVPRSPSPALGAGLIGGGLSNPNSWPNLELLAAFGGPDAAAAGADAHPTLGPGPWEDDMHLSQDEAVGGSGGATGNEMELGPGEEGLLGALISDEHLAASPPPSRPARQAFQPWPFAAGDATGVRPRAEAPACAAPAVGAGFGYPALQQTQLQPRYMPPQPPQALPAHTTPHQAAWCRWAGTAPASAPAGGPSPVDMGGRTVDAWAVAQAGPAQGAPLLHPMAFNAGAAPPGGPALVISQHLQFQAHPGAAGHWPAGAALEQHWQGWAQPPQGPFAPAVRAPPQGRPPGPPF